MAADLQTPLDKAWNVIENALSLQERVPVVAEHVLSEAVQCLQRHGIVHIIEEWFFDVLEETLRKSIGPTFWQHFNTSFSTNSNCPTEHLSTAFSELHAQLSAYTPCLERLELIRSSFVPDATHRPDYVRQRAQILFKAVLFFNPPRHFQEELLQFYTTAFQVFGNTADSENADDSGDDEDCIKCIGCDQEKDVCRCTNIMATFHQLNKHMKELGLLERLSGDAVTSIIHQRIQQHVEHTCQGNFETAYLEVLEKWLQKKVVGWLNLLYPSTTKSAEEEGHMTAYKGRLYHFLYDTYANIRIQQLFNIIIEFPESEPALLDLKVCLEKTDLRNELVQSLKTALETRLLHPGVNTSDILTAYISAIRSLRVLDSTGVLLELVCEPVRKYLRSRDDTVRCIVSSLTDDGSNELSDELVKGEPLVLDESYHSDEDAEDWENWQPDPVDADPGRGSITRRSSDIISMLVNIYGSKELFVNEYRTLLADRILTHFSYDTEKEIRYLELLKLRFGESQLHYCEVMLKDVADSKRINTHITEEREKEPPKEEEVPVNAMVLSAQFWPTFREEKLELPAAVQQCLDTYTKAYEALKGNRTLNWKPHLGMVNLEIELKERKLNMSVSPVHAAIIMHFQDNSKWTVEELSSIMHMSTAAIRRKIAFWQSQGLLKEESPDTFILVEEPKGRAHEVMIMDEDETESAMASQHDQREEELQVFWSYIVGMLTNLESLTLDRIHSMLKMFAMQGPTTVECSLQELKSFLDRKVKEQKLLYSGGVYRLPKPGS